MKKQKENKKSGNQRDFRKQSSILSFFTSRQSSNVNATVEGNSFTVSKETDEETVASNSSSPELIEATPQSKSSAVKKLSNRLNIAFEINGGCESAKPVKKKLFIDSSNTVSCDGIDKVSPLKLENVEFTNGNKRSNDDIFDELFKELENSAGSSVSVPSNQNEISGSRKRLKLHSARSEKMTEKSTIIPTLNLVNKIDKSRFQNVRTNKKTPDKSSDMAKDKNRSASKPTGTKKLSDAANVVDIENLGDLLNDDFDPIITDELSLSSWTYCEITKIEHLAFGIKTQLKEVTNKKNELLSASCYVKGYWGESALQVGDLVSIKARYDHSLDCWLIDEKEGFVVKYPNLLVTGTSIVGSLFCLRRAVLSYLFPGLNPPNISMILGSLVHELFQEILKNKLYKEKDIKLLAADLFTRRRILLDCYECDVSLINLKSEVDKFLPRIMSFINMYILNKIPQKMWAGQIKEILSVEENFWVPHLGVKGKTDLIVKIKTDEGTKIMPVELKTGRPTNSVEHRGQLILYLMMMIELNMDVNTGLLLYLKDNILHEIIPRQGEMNGLVTIRNNLVDYYMKNKKIDMATEKLFSVPALPEPISHHFACSKCPYLTVCSAALSKESNVKLPKTNPLNELSISSIQHLSSSHIDYVFHWLGLLRLEESGKKNGHYANVSDIWLLSPEDRQKRGSCIPCLKIFDVETCDNYILHHMKRSNNNFDLTSSGIVSGDYIVVSCDNRFAISTGFVHQISKDYIILKLDRQLDRQNKSGDFIVDKYSGTEGLLGFNCSNLLLLLEDSDSAATLRDLIIDKKFPCFSAISRSLPDECDTILTSLNSYQRESVLKVLSAENYTLIKGLPGTGKTATIIALIKILVRLNLSVLITSHTHSAVDNVLMRVKDSVDFLRLGSSSKVNTDIRSFCEDTLLSDQSINSTEDVENFYNKKRVVGVTCMGCSHVLLMKRKFDFCIVDEATQVLQPSTLKALYSARKFVLIGDPDQLPPVVHNFEASRLGLSESLFHRLDRPEVTTTLHLQYRMNAEIMQLANDFAYGNQLKCDSEDVNLATIKVNTTSELIQQCEWLKFILSSELSHSVLFLNTSNLLVSDSDSVYSNQVEVDVTGSVINALKQNFKKPYDIGVIAPYREQVLLLRKTFSSLHSDVEINTVDQFQGRDKDIIIFSSTRWCNQKEEGILGDERRLTVAITRAKRKLIIVGSGNVLQECSTFNKLLSCISKRNVVDVKNL